MRGVASISFLALIFASPAWGQTAIQPGSIVGTFNAQNYAPAQGAPSNLTIYTVPGDRNARVTDIVAVSYYGTPCTVSLNMSSTSFYFKVNPEAVQSFHFQTGYGLTAGTAITLSPGNCPSSSVYVQLRGFHFTIP